MVLLRPHPNQPLESVLGWVRLLLLEAFVFYWGIRKFIKNRRRQKLLKEKLRLLDQREAWFKLCDRFWAQQAPLRKRVELYEFMRNHRRLRHATGRV